MEVGMVKSHKKYILTNRERRVLFLPWTSPVKDTFCFLNMALQVTFVFWRRASFKQVLAYISKIPCWRGQK